jgi:AICAR transformylase/IMP cyclohydrolase PurH
LPVTQLLEYKSVAGGLLVQTRDTGVIEAQELRAVTKRVPTLAELDDLIFRLAHREICQIERHRLRQDKATWASAPAR